ncbi:MAG: hypothetical protein H0U89_05720 [Acidimicrobiia bacterium]|nr:hypothetical protein [Acidimicrobiia bacterium]
MKEAPQEHDVVIVKERDEEFSITQLMTGGLRHLEGPISGRDAAEARARALAGEQMAEAWFQVTPDIYLLLQ